MNSDDNMSLTERLARVRWHIANQSDPALLDALRQAEQALCEMIDGRFGELDVAPTKH